MLPAVRTLYWFGLSENQWAIAGSFATVIGVVAAIGAGTIALISYWSATKAAADAHMHALFRDYLRTRFDHAVARWTMSETSATPRGKVDKVLIYEVASLKLYALEEMWSWIDWQERDPLGFLKRPTSKQKERQRDALASWCATIWSHIRDDEEEVIKSIHNFTDCYSMGFLTFLHPYWPDRPGYRILLDKQVEWRAKGLRQANSAEFRLESLKKVHSGTKRPRKRIQLQRDPDQTR